MWEPPRSATLQEEFHARTLCIPKAAAPVVHSIDVNSSPDLSNDGSQNEQEGTVS
jgi:hypothetical protein